MSNPNPKSLLSFSLDGHEREKARALITMMAQVASKGGGKVPMGRVLDILQFKAAVAERVRSSRGALVIKSPEGRAGKLRGTFTNMGDVLRETAPAKQSLQPEFTIDRLVGGYFSIGRDSLELSKITGLRAALLLIGSKKNKPLFTYRIQRVLLQPTMVSFD